MIWERSASSLAPALFRFCAQLLDGEMIVLDHAVEAPVHLDRADRDLLLHRFLQLQLFGFQHFQDLAANARLAAPASVGLVDSRCSARYSAMRWRSSKSEMDSSFTVATMELVSLTVSGSAASITRRVIVLGFLDRGRGRIGLFGVRLVGVGSALRPWRCPAWQDSCRGGAGNPGGGLGRGGAGDGQARARRHRGHGLLAPCASAAAPASQTAAPSIRVVAIRIVNLIGRKRGSVHGAPVDGPLNLCQNTEFPGPDQGKRCQDAPNRPESKVYATGRRAGFCAPYGRVRAKTSRGNRLKGWIGLSPVFRLKTAESPRWRAARPGSGPRCICGGRPAKWPGIHPHSPGHIRY